MLILVELLGDAFIPREELHLPTELGIHLLLVRASFFRWLAELLADRRVEAGKTVIEDFLAFGADDRLDLFADLGRLLFPNRKLSLVMGGFRVRPKRDVIVSLGMSEKRLQAVVVGLQDGVELVIVALGAAEGEAQKNGAHRIGHVVQNFLPAEPKIPLIGLVRVVAVESRCNACRGIVGP